MRLFVALSLACGPFTVTAQVPPQSERGFKPDQVYDFHGIDSVNVYNGNVNITLPLASYPVSADVSYSFDLRYSGKVWTSHLDCPVGVVDPNPPDCKVLWLLEGNDNAGVGWRLSFGELQKWTGSPNGTTSGSQELFQYTAPDGADHLFYPTLHDPPCPPGSTTDCDPVNAGVFYTRDGTLLRLKVGTSAAIIEFPNGQRHRHASVGSTANYRLESIYGAASELDADGEPLTNWVKFEQSGPDWNISDSHGRQHVVHFQPSYPYSAIDYVRLAAVRTPSDPPASSPRAEFNFVYDNVDSSQDGAAPQLTLPCDWFHTNQELSQTVSFLRRIDTPAGDKWEFHYVQPPPGSGCEFTSGAITRVVLPTGGRINWAYAPSSPIYDSFMAGPKVSERCLRRDDECCSAGTANSNQQDEYATYVSGTVLTGTNSIVNWGRKSTGSWAPDFKAVFQYMADGEFQGLPIDPTSTDGQGRFLSSETFDCNVETGACGADPERRRYVKYEMDYVTDCNVGFPCSRDRDRRVVSERTQYLSGGSEAGTVDVDYSLYDGLGHYRQIVTWDKLGGGGTRVAYVGYNNDTRGLADGCGGSSGTVCNGSSVGTYALTSYSKKRAAGFTMLAPSDSWILGTHTSSFRSITDATGQSSTTAQTEACFDPRTGFLRRTRVKRRADGVADARDLLTVFTRDSASGYPAREEWFGGDGQDGQGNLNTAALCSMNPPAHDAFTYRRDHTYAYGVLESSRYMNGASPLSFYSVENSVIDPNTGLVREAKDVSGLATSFEYDHAGRLTKVSPPGAAATAYTYTTATATTAAAVEAETNAVSGAVRSRYEYDPFGRLARTKALQPSESGQTADSIVDMTYDHMGRRKTVSEPYFEGATTQVFTSYEYDHFGRTTRLTAPDNTATTWSYDGRDITRRSTVQLVGGPTPVDVVERYDGFGRLVEVQEPSGHIGGTVFTTYKYDVGDRLTSVEMKGTETGNPVQSRTFTYDLLGLLREEKHPESDRIYYSRYDARGHARWRLLGDPAVANRVPTPHDQRFTFDKAERLTLVEVQRPDTTVSSFLNLKQFTFGTANGVQDTKTNYTKGKLLSAARWNYDPDPLHPTDSVFRVTETYAYADAGGRSTDRTTLIEWSEQDLAYGRVREIKQHVENNDLGLPSRIDYPSCINCGYTATKSVAPIYSAGKLWRLERTDDANAVRGIAVMTYWPNGMTKTVLHGNGVMDSVDLADGMPRPQRIQFQTWTECIRPSWVTLTMSPASIVSPGQSVTLTASVGPSLTTPPIEYRWLKWEDAGYWSDLAVTSLPSLSVTPTRTTSYKVIARNACQFAASGTVTTDVVVAEAALTVTVSTCDAPQIAAQPESRAAVSGAAVSLTVTATGTSPLSYAWYVVGTNTAVGTNSRVLNIPAITQTTRYACRVSNSCGEVVTSTATVTVSLPNPTALTATLSSPQAIVLTWAGAQGAHHYVIERMTPGGSFAAVGTATGLSYTDSGLPLGKTYVYRVYAVDAAGGSASAVSNRELATTMAFTNVVAGGAIDDGHFAELLTALNAMQTANGWPALTWTTILPAGVPAPSAGTPVAAAHLAALRDKLSIARQALGVAAGSFADDPLRPGETVIRAAHITALQQRAQ